MGVQVTRVRALAAIVCLAGLLVTGETVASAGSAGGGQGAMAVGAPDAAGVRARRPAVIVLTPDVSYPPNALCDSLGLGQDSTVQVDGSRFKPIAAPYTVKLGTKLVAEGTTTPTGTFTTTFEVPQQPFGVYPVTAKAGRKTATANLGSSAQSCWSSVGTSGTPLAWNWSGSGFDAATTAILRVDGTPIKSLVTSAKGAFNTSFNASCPVGPRPVTLEASFGGTVSVSPFGTANC